MIYSVGWNCDPWCTAQFRNQNAFQYDNTASCCWNTVVQNLQIKTSVIHCLGSGTNLHTIQSKKQSKTIQKNKVARG